MTCRNPRCTLCNGLLWDSPKYAVRSIREQTTSSTSTARRRRTDLSYTAKASPRRRNHAPSAAPQSRAPAAVAGILVGAMDDFELLQRPAGAHRDTGQRRLGQMRRHLGLLAKAIVQPLQQGTTPGEHDAAIHDVGCELGRGSVQRFLHGLEDLRDRLLERLADLLAGQDDGLGQARDHVATANLRLDLLSHREGRADLQLQLLRGLLADQQLVLALGVVDDRLVQLVS